ncbi:MAG TPA: hypothetical protein EYN66_24525 [Myxococcales bacterium]|nr:hypothetical protein [Myxococcales bacterium]
MHEAEAGVPTENELVEVLEDQDVVEEQVRPPPMPPPLPGHAFKSEGSPDEEDDVTLDLSAATEFDHEGLLVVDAITDDGPDHDDDIIELDEFESDFFSLEFDNKNEHANPILVTADAFQPTAEELESLAHELSLMIRMEKRNHRKKSMIGIAAVLIVGSMIAVNLIHRSNQAARALANREANNKNPGAIVTNPDETSPVYAVTKNSNQKKNDKPSNASNREILMWESGEAEKKNGIRIRRKDRTAPAAKKKKLNKETFAKLTRDSSGKSETLISMGSLGSHKKPKPVENREVSTLIQRRSKAFRRCLSSGSGDGVSLSFTVQRSGNVSNIHVSTGGGEDGAKVKQCVKNIVSKWIFAPVPEPQTFRRSLAL